MRFNTHAYACNHFLHTNARVIENLHVHAWDLKLAWIFCVHMQFLKSSCACTHFRDVFDWLGWQVLLPTDTITQSWNRSGNPVPVRPDRTGSDRTRSPNRPDKTGFLPVHRCKIFACISWFFTEKWGFFFNPESKNNSNDIANEKKIQRSETRVAVWQNDFSCMDNNWSSVMIVLIRKRHKA